MPKQPTPEQTKRVKRYNNRDIKEPSRNGDGEVNKAVFHAPQHDLLEQSALGSVSMFVEPAGPEELVWEAEEQEWDATEDGDDCAKQRAVEDVVDG